MSGGEFVRRDAEFFWRFAEKVSQEVRAWPSWKLKAAAGSFCSPQLQPLSPASKSTEGKSERGSESESS